MYERVPDTCVCIPLTEYRELIETSARYSDLLSKYWTLEKEVRKTPGPLFGGKEADHETNT